MRQAGDYIARPVRSLQSMLRVIAKAEPEVPSVVPDGIYGGDTENAIRAFQTAHNLPATGQTDNATWNAVVEAYTHCASEVLPACPLYIRWDPLQVLHPGDRNLHLYLIQGMLMALDRVYNPIPDVQATGVYDEATRQAITWLLERSDLPDENRIDQAVWEYLCGLYCISTGNGESSCSAS